MKKQLWPFLALTFFTQLGNGQDGAEVSTTPPPEGWGVHGNAAWSKYQHNAETEKAAAAARQKKALMESMASVAHKPPTFTTAEQYLQFHKPPAPAPGESPPPSPVRRDTYVPQFETAPPRSPSRSAASNVSSGENPRKRGLFALFDKSDGAESPSFESSPISDPGLPPAAAYPETPAAPAMNAPALAVPAGNPEALAAATQGASGGEKATFFGRIFGKERATAPSPPPGATLANPVPPVSEGTAAPSALPPAAGGSAVPAPPGFNDRIAPAPLPDGGGD